MGAIDNRQSRSCPGPVVMQSVQSLYSMGKNRYDGVFVLNVFFTVDFIRILTKPR